MDSKLSYANVFDAICDDPMEAIDLQFRSHLIMTLVSLIERKGLNQTEAAKLLGVPKPRVSELMRGKISLFSSDRLIGYLGKLGYRLHPHLNEAGEVDCSVIPLSA